MTTFEVWEDPNTKTQFYFSHSNEEFTTGVMVLPPGAELPKHNRPKAYENLVQVSGKCRMIIFDEDDQPIQRVLVPGSSIRMGKGQFHIHSNPYTEPSLTLFKAEGDITEIMKVLRETFIKVEVK